jgi:hypothetical protein
MARAEPELRPCGIAAGYVVASRHTSSSEFAPHPPKHTIGTFMRSSTDSAMAAPVGITRTLTCFPRAR